MHSDDGRVAERDDGDDFEPRGTGRIGSDRQQVLRTQRRWPDSAERVERPASEHDIRSGAAADRNVCAHTIADRTDADADSGRKRQRAVLSDLARHA